MALEELSRAQLVDIINAETGQSRRFVGYTKKSLIDCIHGFQDFSPPASNLSSSPPNLAAPLSAAAAASRIPLPARRMKQIDALGSPNATRCANAACRAQLEPGSDFCKRCSCWICLKYDDNKDTSLWVVCDKDDGELRAASSCGLSCHIHCAIRKGAEAISDCAYLCLSCGARTGLVGRVKKLLAQAAAARRVDVLHERLVISTKCLSGTAKDGKYGMCAEIVQSALDKLAQEIGPFSKGLVSRLACSTEVLGLTKRALESLETCDAKTARKPDVAVSVFQIQFKEVTTSSVQLAVALKSHDESSGRSILGYKLWHRRSRGHYNTVPTVMISVYQKALVTNLDPGTGYMFRAVAFSAKGDEGFCETRCYTKRLEPSLCLGRRRKVQVVELVQVEDGGLADPKPLEACSVDCKEKSGSEPAAPVSLPLQAEEAEIPVQETADAPMVLPEEEKTCTLSSVPVIMDMDLNLSPKDVEQASLSDIDAQGEPPQTMENVQMETACEMNTHEDGALLDFKAQETCPVYSEEKWSSEPETLLPVPPLSQEGEVPVDESTHAAIVFSEEKKTSSSSDSAVLDMELNSSSNDAVQANIVHVDERQQNCAIVQHESSWQTRVNAQLDNACETKNATDVKATAEPEKTPFRACSLRLGNLIKISESVRKLTAKVTPKSSTNETSTNETSGIAETLNVDNLQTIAVNTNATEATASIPERVDINTVETTADIPESANTNAMEPAENIPDEVNTKAEDANLLSIPDNSNINLLRATSCQWMVPHPVEEPCDITPPTKALTADINPVSRKRKREKTALAIRNINNRENPWRWTDKTFEHCVKIVRWLECQGHVKSEFRMRFLTWLGLKAIDQQRRVVSIYIQSMMDDPVSLAEQLVDAFEEATKRNSN